MVQLIWREMSRAWAWRGHLDWGVFAYLQVILFLFPLFKCSQGTKWIPQRNQTQQKKKWSPSPQVGVPRTYIWWCWVSIEPSAITGLVTEGHGEAVEGEFIDRKGEFRWARFSHAEIYTVIPRPWRGTGQRLGREEGFFILMHSSNRNIRLLFDWSENISLVTVYSKFCVSGLSAVLYMQINPDWSGSWVIVLHKQTQYYSDSPYKWDWLWITLGVLTHLCPPFALLLQPTFNAQPVVL